MRLVDFLILVLEAHSETLKRLAAFFGEERLLEMLEGPGEEDEGGMPFQALDLKSVPFAVLSKNSPMGSRSSYVELEGAVRDFGLPEVLEFHLWAYPYYRAYIESGLDLGSTIASSNPEAGTVLVDEAIRCAREWVHRLPIPPAVSLQAETAAGVPWIRFRTCALKKMGKRPIGPVV